MRVLRSRAFAIRPSATALFASLAWLACGPAAAQASKGDAALGAYLSSECVTCHQVSGRYEGIPPIIGWPQESFIEIMNEYRHKKRPNAVMQTIAARFSDEELAALATFFGGLTPTAR